MALRRFVQKIAKPIEEIDREKLEEFTRSCGVARIDGIEARTRARVAGEIKSVRIVPRAGAAAVEATVNDGSGSVTAVFLGRRRVGGVSNGRRLVLEGMVVADGPRRLMYNPIYELR